MAGPSWLIVARRRTAQPDTHARGQPKRRTHRQRQAVGPFRRRHAYVRFCSLCATHGLRAQLRMHTCTQLRTELCPAHRFCCRAWETPSPSVFWCYNGACAPRLRTCVFSAFRSSVNTLSRAATTSAPEAVHAHRCQAVTAARSDDWIGHGRAEAVVVYHGGNLGQIWFKSKGSIDIVVGPVFSHFVIRPILKSHPEFHPIQSHATIKYS